MIAQIDGEVTPGSIHRYVLFDAEFYADLPTLVPEADRSTRLVPKQLTRAQILRLLGVYAYCQRTCQSNRRCLFWRNNVLVPDQRLHHLDINHGDYIRIALPPDHITADLYTTREMAAICYNGDAIFADLGEQGAHLITEMLPQVPLDTPVAYTIPSTFYNGDEMQMMQVTGPTRDERIERHHPSFYELPHFKRQLQEQITSRISNPSICSFQPYMVHSWNLDHERIPFQRHERLVHLNENVAEWKNAILEVWSDLLLQSTPANLHLVQPQPRTDFGGFEVHIIITQNPISGLASVLLSTQKPDFARGFQQRVALAMLRITSRQEVIDHVEARMAPSSHGFQVEHICSDRTVLEQALIYPMRDGQHLWAELQLHIAPPVLELDRELSMSPTLPFTVAEDTEESLLVQTLMQPIRARSFQPASDSFPTLRRADEDLQAIRVQNKLQRPPLMLTEPLKKRCLTHWQTLIQCFEIFTASGLVLLCHGTDKNCGHQSLFGIFPTGAGEFVPLVVLPGFLPMSNCGETRFCIHGSTRLLTMTMRRSCWFHPLRFREKEKEQHMSL